MLVENQLVKTSWNNYTKKYYENKGYVFTKRGDIFYVSVQDLPISSGCKVKVECDICGSIIDVIYSNYNKYTNNGTNKYVCEKCKGNKIKATFKNIKGKTCYEKFIHLCNEYDHIPVSTFDDYTNSHSKLYFICSKHGMQGKLYLDMRDCNNNICKWCSYEESSSKRRLSIDEVKQAVESKNNNKLINAHDYVNRKKKNLKIQCGSCGNIFISSYENVIVSGGHCHDCGVELSYAGKNKLLPKDVKTLIESVNGNLWINQDGYQSMGIINLKIQCGSCGNIYTASLGNYLYKNQTRCPICSRKMSYGEFLISQCLEENNIEFNFQARFDDCYDIFTLPFDFYLPDNNIIIEFDGLHHMEPIYGEERFKITKLHDAMKNQYCKWNNIDLLRIPYWDRDNIEQILIDYLHLTPQPSSHSTKIKYIPNRKTA